MYLVNCTHTPTHLLGHLAPDPPSPPYIGLQDGIDTVAINNIGRREGRKNIITLFWKIISTNYVWESILPIQIQSPNKSSK